MATYIWSTAISNAYIGIPFPESIVLDKSSITLTTIWQTEQLTATLTPTPCDQSITWVTSDSTVATVSTSWLVTCVTPWTCTITATTVNGLTASCSVRPPRLPSAYQEVEYLENNWTCYINTGLQIKDGYRSVQKLRFLAYQTYDWGYVTWGYIWADSWLPWGHARLYVWNGRSWTTWWSYGYLSSYTNWTTAIATIGTDYDMDFSWVSGDAFLKIDWTSYFTSSNTYSTSLSWPVSVFAGGYEPNSTKAHPWLRVYYAKYYDNTDTLVRELIPCYRIADSVIWMYDLVNDVFYTNAWTWTFTKWQDV